MNGKENFKENDKENFAMLNEIRIANKENLL